MGFFNNDNEAKVLGYSKTWNLLIYNKYTVC